MITEHQYQKAVKKRDEAAQVIQNFHNERVERFEKRWDKFIFFKAEFLPKELVYSAYRMCSCGHGLAYPMGCGTVHRWTCAGYLTGVHKESRGHDSFSFEHHVIVSEVEGDGSTTRPFQDRSNDVAAQ